VWQSESPFINRAISLGIIKVNLKNINHMKTPKLFLVILLLLAFCIANGQQDSTQSEKDAKILSVIPGNTKMVLTAVGWFGFQAHLNRADNTIPKTTFNDFGFSPMFLWKLSDKFFFESEVEIKNDGTAGNSAAFDLEFAKLSYRLNKYMTFGAGKMLSPFGAYNERWEPNHIEKFPNAPLRPDDGVLLDDTHLFWGAIMGVDLRGGIPLGSAKMNYAVYISNGPTLHTEKEMGGMLQYENWNDNNSNKEIGGRIGLLPFSNSSLEIGFSAKHGIAGNEGDPLYSNVSSTAIAFDLSYIKNIEAIKSTINFRGQYNSLSTSKADYQLTDNTTYTFDNKLKSYFAQFTIRPSMAPVKFVKKLELMFRYGNVMPPKDAVWSPKDLNGQGGNISRFDLGLAYWISWRNAFRIAYETTSMPDGTKQNEFIARLAVGL
jgi:hypothetical protein